MTATSAADNQRERSEKELRDLVEKIGQEHVFRFWPELRAHERAALLFQLNSFDFDSLGQLFDEVLSTVSESTSEIDPATLAPAPVQGLPTTAEEERLMAETRERGEETLSSGKVACFTVAGGQGTRLGYSGPKGMYRVGPVTNRTLFELFAATIAALSKRYGCTIPWYIMVSESNRSETEQYFQQNAYFGLAAGSVHFVQQAMLPAVDQSGRFLLEHPHRIATSPNGHGGSIKALNDTGALKAMVDLGLKAIYYFQVDNPLAKICDPAFLGFHTLTGSEFSSKVLRKASWSEKVGVMCNRDGKPRIVEYIDLPEDLARDTDEDGNLRFWAGSIAIHIISVDFLKRLNEAGLELPYHAAKKKVAYVETEGQFKREKVQPDYPNAIKLETFVFDALQYAESSFTMETSRAEEFSPIKNATGNDSPVTCRRDMTEFYLRWLESCGASVERTADGNFDGAVEINPLTALNAQELKARVPSGTIIRNEFTI